MALIQKLSAFGKRVVRDEQGVVTVEWAAIAGIFVVVAVATFLLIGDKVSTIIGAVDTQMNTIVTDANFPGAGG
jgi:Flp pilus assembly pilin Flp